jgi:hypothetical protein
MYINFRSLFSIRFVWVPLLLSSIFYGAYVYLEPNTSGKVQRVRSLDSKAHVNISKLWVEGTYRSVGLGVSEGLQSQRLMFSMAKPLHVKNPVTNLVLRNNLSIACLQMDALWSYSDKSNIFMVEGNITLKGDRPFNHQLNNSVVYTKSYYLRDGNQYSLMSTSIDKSKPRNQFKRCSSTKTSATRNIRFDNYLEQMNALTYPSGYLHVDGGIEDSYITNEEYLMIMASNVPKEVKINKTAKSAGGLFMALLSIPGVLNTNKTLSSQSAAIEADRAALLVKNKAYGDSMNIRIKYLTRMSDTLKCGRLPEYKSICDLGNGITYLNTKGR